MTLNRSKPLPKPRTPDTMMLEEIVGKFVDVLEKLEPIYVQPSYRDLTLTREVVVPILLLIPYDETGGTHNRISLLWPLVAYTTCYGAEFAEPKCVGAYNANIYDNTTADFRAGTEVAQKAKRANRGT